jgi:phosphatidate cytidylyltransferase
MSEPGEGTAAGPAGLEPVHPRPPTPVDAPAPAAKKASDLGARLLTASILIPLVLYLIYLGGLAYLAAVIGFILLMMREFYTLIEEKGAHPLTRWGYAAGATLPIVAYVGNEYHVTLLMTAVLTGVMVSQLNRPRIEEALASISGTFFGVFYVGWLFSHTIVLRDFHDVVVDKMGPAAGVLHPDQSGAYYMVFAAVCLVLCDAGAYFAGRRFGRRKLAPRISPGKSVEGAIGGVLVGTLAGPATRGIFLVIAPDLVGGFGWGASLVFGFLISVAGMVGDLVESLLKRDAEVKDAGGLLPGMGGLLDRLDSPLLGIPLMYYLLLAYTYVQVG